MAFDFPTSPSAGQEFTPAGGGPTYVWESPRWLLKTTDDFIVDNLTITGSLTPSVTNTIDLGSAALRWRTVYTSDLSLSNGVGDWTIVEGADDLFITNNRNGKRYKFALVEVEDGD